MVFNPRPSPTRWSLSLFIFPTPSLGWEYLVYQTVMPIYRPKIFSVFILFCFFEDLLGWMILFCCFFYPLASVWASVLWPLWFFVVFLSFLSLYTGDLLIAGCSECRISNFGQGVQNDVFYLGFQYLAIYTSGLFLLLILRKFSLIINLIRNSCNFNLIFCRL